MDRPSKSPLPTLNPSMLDEVLLHPMSLAVGRRIEEEKIRTRRLAAVLCGHHREGNHQKNKSAGLIVDKTTTATFKSVGVVPSTSSSSPPRQHFPITGGEAAALFTMDERELEAKVKDYIRTLTDEAPDPLRDTLSTVNLNATINTSGQEAVKTSQAQLVARKYLAFLAEGGLPGLLLEEQLAEKERAKNAGPLSAALISSSRAQQDNMAGFLRACGVDTQLTEHERVQERDEEEMDIVLRKRRDRDDRQHFAYRESEQRVNYLLRHVMRMKHSAGSPAGAIDAAIASVPAACIARGGVSQQLQQRRNVSLGAAGGGATLSSTTQSFTHHREAGTPQVVPLTHGGSATNKGPSVILGGVGAASPPRSWLGLSNASPSLMASTHPSDAGSVKAMSNPDLCGGLHGSQHVPVTTPPPASSLLTEGQSWIMHVAWRIVCAVSLLDIMSMVDVHHQRDGALHAFGTTPCPVPSMWHFLVSTIFPRWFRCGCIAHRFQQQQLLIAMRGAQANASSSSSTSLPLPPVEWVVDILAHSVHAPASCEKCPSHYVHDGDGFFAAVRHGFTAPPSGLFDMSRCHTSLERMQKTLQLQSKLKHDATPCPRSGSSHSISSSSTSREPQGRGNINNSSDAMQHHHTSNIVSRRMSGSLTVAMGGATMMRSSAVLPPVASVAANVEPSESSSRRQASATTATETNISTAQYVALIRPTQRFVTALMTRSVGLQHHSASFCLTRVWYLRLPVSLGVVTAVLGATAANSIPRGLHDGSWRLHVVRCMTDALSVNIGGHCQCMWCTDRCVMEETADGGRPSPLPLLSLDAWMNVFDNHSKTCSMMLEHQLAPIQPPTMAGEHDAPSAVSTPSVAHLLTGNESSEDLSLDLGTALHAQQEEESRLASARLHEHMRVRSGVQQRFLKGDRDKDGSWTMFEWARETAAAGVAHLSGQAASRNCGSSAQRMQSIDDKVNEFLSLQCPLLSARRERTTLSTFVSVDGDEKILVALETILGFLETDCDDFGIVITE